jgi:hypothetical protein
MKLPAMLEGVLASYAIYLVSNEDGYKPTNSSNGAKNTRNNKSRKFMTTTGGNDGTAPQSLAEASYTYSFGRILTAYTTRLEADDIIHFFSLG